VAVALAEQQFFCFSDTVPPAWFELFLESLTKPEAQETVVVAHVPVFGVQQRAALQLFAFEGHFVLTALCLLLYPVGH
jgi:hypothetical protein